MSQALLFAVGVVVFFITVCATLIYGYSVVDRISQAEVAERQMAGQADDSSRSEGPSLAHG